MLAFLIVLALVYAFLNGYRDSSSILAGVIASRAMHPRLALYLAGVAEFIAPFLFGVAVAKSIATGLIDPQAIELQTLVVAMIAALSWTAFAWWRGIPSSSSHALIGGLLGAALLADGWRALQPGGIVRVVLPLFIAPPLGFALGYLVMLLLLGLFAESPPSVNSIFRRLQVFTMFGLALAHSANDSQKTMGIIVLGLYLTGRINTFYVPKGVVLVSAAAIALGAMRGDWRLIRTLGGKIYRIRPVNALASQTASSMVVMGSALVGAPVSTSQVISMGLMGAGSAERLSKVRWHIGAEMLATWGLTIPVTLLAAASLSWMVLQAAHLQQVVAWLLGLLVSG